MTAPFFVAEALMAHDMADTDTAATPAKAARGTRAKPAAKAAPDHFMIEDRVVDAALALAAEGPWEGVTLADIAGRADLSLSDLYPRLGSRGRILEAFARRVDARMLATDATDLAGERPRDRLFDALMARFDVLLPYRDALRSIVATLSRDPLATLGQVRALDRSMAWTLEAAGIVASGWRGRLKVRALGSVYISVLSIWLEDGPDQARTMAELDRLLVRLEGMAGRLGLVARSDSTG